MTAHYDIIETPIGPLLLIATARGLRRIAFAAEDHAAVLAAVDARRQPALLHSAARQLGEYLAGTRRRFDLELDLAGISPFRRAALDAVAVVPYGETTTYSDLAIAAGAPRAVRAAGHAMATNPLPLVFPCHRALRRDGGLGGFLGGLDTKRWLLELESNALVQSYTPLPAVA